MTDIDFYADTLRNENVLGVGPGSGLVEIEQALNGEYVDDVGKGWMRRDYGLIEFHLNMMNGDWACFGISVQVHRIAKFGAEVIPRILNDRYGPFNDSVELEQLVRATNSRGESQLLPEEAGADFLQYRIDGSNAVLNAHRPPTKSVDDGFYWQVWSLQISGG